MITRVINTIQKTIVPVFDSGQIKKLKNTIPIEEIHENLNGVSLDTFTSVLKNQQHNCESANCNHKR